MSDAVMEAAERREALRAELVTVTERVPQVAREFKSIREYAHLVEERHWTQRWDPLSRKLSDDPVEMKGMVWSAAIERSLKEQNGVSIPAMPEPLYLDRSIIVKTGSRVIVHPKTEIRMIIDEVEHCLIRNRSIVSGQEGPVEPCRDADRDILIEGGIWSDQKNNGHGPQGFRKGEEGLMLGSQGAIVLSNVEKYPVLLPT